MQHPVTRRLRYLFLFFLFFAVGAPLALDAEPVPAAHAKKKRKKRKKKKKKKSKKASTADDKAEDDDGKKSAGGSVPEKEPEKEEELRTTGPADIKAPVGEKKVKKKDLTAEADKKRDESIAEIASVLPKVKGGQKGELVFRLAELYWAKSKYIYQTEFEEFDAAYQKWVDTGRQGKEPTLERFTKKSEAYKKQALKNYKVVLKDYPEYPRLDEVLYIMAYNEYQAGKKKAGIKNYSKLIRQFPNSEYVADSYLALGEHYFTANDLSRATKAYTKAYDKGREINKPITYRYAEYKLAWCDYNAENYDKALTKFKNVVEESEKAAQGDKDGAQLKGEALNDMVLTYSQLNEVDKAYKYFKKKAGGEKSYHLMSKLSGVYESQGKFDNQIKTLRRLINIDPDNASAPDYQARIVSAYSKLGKRDKVRKEITRLVELYRPGSPWWNKNKDNEMATERALVVAEQRMRELVTDYHRYADKHKTYDDYELARDLYGQYLQAFPTSEQAYTLNFYYAEILWDLGQWRDAAEQYDAVVARDAKGRYTRDCAYNAILAWEKIVANEPKPVRNKDGLLVKNKKKQKGKIANKKVKLEKVEKNKEYKPEDIPEPEQKLADACDAYVRVVPEELSKKDPKLEEELIVVKFKSAYTYHKYFHFDQAAERFGELIGRWPDNEYARRGADSILDSYAAREKWKPLEKWSREFAAVKPLMKDKDFAKSVFKFMQGASFKSIQEDYNQGLALEKKEKKKTPEVVAIYTQSAERFEGFVKEFPDSEFAPIAMFNAMDIYDGANKLDLAIRATNHLLEKYPKEIGKDQLGEINAERKCRLNLVRYHEKIADYENSAKYALEYFEKYKDDDKAPDVLYNSGIFYLGLGDTKRAVESFKTYLEKFKDAKDTPDVYLRMAAVYEDAEEWVTASGLYDGFEQKYGKKATKEQIMNSRYKTALLQEKAGRADQSLATCEDILKRYKKDVLKKSDVGQLAGGYCAFKVLESEWEAYKQIKIATTKKGKKGMKEIKDNLDAKLKQRDIIGKKYFDVLSYGNGEWGVAGLYRAAEVLLEYVDALRNAPDPPALANNFDALDIFRAELDNKLLPVEDQAIQALESALQKAFELGIYSPYTLAIEDRLRTFKPSAFGEVHGLPFYDASGTSDKGDNKQAADDKDADKKKTARR